MRQLLHDLRTAVRSLSKSPGYAAATIAILALGIGANAAIFSVVRTVLLRPLPFADSERIVRVWETYSNGQGQGAVSPPNFRDWREQTTSFESLAALWYGSRNLSGGDEPVKLPAIEATSSLFDVLGATPLLGRTFTPEEERLEASPVVVIGERLWRDRYGSDQALLGGTIVLDGTAHTVVGILPASFRFPVWGDRRELFLPLRVPEKLDQRGNHYLNVMGKLRSGVPLESASEELSGITRRLVTAWPEAMTGRGAMIEDFTANVRSFVSGSLRLLFAAVSAVLLIACTNLAGLALARASARHRETTLRAALGASRSRLARTLLTESLLLSLAGAVGAALVAAALLELARPIAAAELPDLGPLRLDLTVGAYLLAAGLFVGLLFGLAPALSGARVDLARSLSDASSRSTSGRAKLFARRTLVAVQLALSVTLLVGAGLLLRTMAKLQSTSPGFDRVGVLTLHLSPPQGDPRTERLAEALLTPILERVRALPGVEKAGLLSLLPVQNAGWNSSYSVVGLDPPKPGDDWWVETRAASPEALEALGVPLRAGRWLDRRDATATSATDARTPVTVLVNEAWVRRHFPNAPLDRALGREIRFGPEEAVTIVGVYGDTRQGGLDQEPLPELTFAYDDVRLTGSFFARDVVLVVRSPLPAGALAKSIGAAVREVDPLQPLHTVKTIDQVLADSLSERRLTMKLVGAFAAVAVLLAATGLYALIAFLVAQRTREIGVRMALGATAAEISRWVVRDGLLLASAGAALGLAGGWGASKLVAHQLHGVGPLDPATWTGVVVLLVAVVVAACLAPAARAARVDPIHVLRQE